MHLEANGTKLYNLDGPRTSPRGRIQDDEERWFAGSVVFEKCMKDNGMRFFRPDPFSRNPGLFIDLNPAGGTICCIDRSSQVRTIRFSETVLREIEGFMNQPEVNCSVANPIAIARAMKLSDHTEVRAYEE